MKRAAKLSVIDSHLSERTRLTFPECVKFDTDEISYLVDMKNRSPLECRGYRAFYGVWHTDCMAMVFHSW